VEDDLIDRKKEIQNIVNRSGYISVKELSRLTDASLATVRRDLADLDSAGLLTRTRGGAVPSVNSYDKNEIYSKFAGRAIPLIKSGDVVVLPGGMINSVLATQIAELHNVSVVTNSPDIFNCLRYSTHNDIIITGGVFDKSNMVFYGTVTDTIIRTMRADLFFAEASGYDPANEAFYCNFKDAHVYTLMMKAARRTVVFLDNDSNDTSSGCHFCHANEVDIAITNGDQKIATAKVLGV
jgi:DeoR/GlpR family transcriptional regulator of sugar metabolism